MKRSRHVACTADALAAGDEQRSAQLDCSCSVANARCSPSCTSSPAICSALERFRFDSRLDGPGRERNAGCAPAPRPRAEAHGRGGASHAGSRRAVLPARRAHRARSRRAHEPWAALPRPQDRRRRSSATCSRAWTCSCERRARTRRRCAPISPKCCSRRATRTSRPDHPRRDEAGRGSRSRAGRPRAPVARPSTALARRRATRLAARQRPGRARRRSRSDRRQRSAGRRRPALRSRHVRRRSSVEDDHGHSQHQSV